VDSRSDSAVAASTEVPTIGANWMRALAVTAAFWAGEGVVAAPGVGGVGRADDLEAGGVAEVRLDALGVVEGAAGDDAVGGPDRYGHVPGAVGAVVEAGGLVDDLVEGRRDEVGELYLGYRAHPVDGEPDGGAGDQALRQRRVQHPRGPELLL
jgi:hypothetical protein